jgi:hypothetical protein
MHLFRSDEFAAGMEDAYTQMWQLWADGKMPEQISASAGSGTGSHATPRAARAQTKPHLSSDEPVTAAGAPLAVSRGEYVLVLPH